MNTRNVTVKRTTNVLLAAYIVNRKALAEHRPAAAPGLPAAPGVPAVHLPAKIGVGTPLVNPWR